jgi:hypothetical protein
LQDTSPPSQKTSVCHTVLQSGSTTEPSDTIVRSSCSLDYYDHLVF